MGLEIYKFFNFIFDCLCIVPRTPAMIVIRESDIPFLLF